MASRLRDLQHHRAAIAGAALVLVALLASQAIPAGQGPGGSQPPASGPIAWTSAPPSSGPGVTPSPWTRLVLGPEQRLADLTATQPIGNRVATTSHFVLRAVAGLSASDLAAGIKVEPEVKLAVTPGASPDSVSLEPSVTLRDGTRYRFRLYAPDGSLLGTWAFRTDAPLHVVGRIPDDKTGDVPPNTGIEVTFDRSDVVDFASHFSIVPKVDGRFEQHDQTWVFVPTKPLAPTTIYTVTVTKGLAASGSGRTLGADVSWRFKTWTTDGSRQGVPRFDQPMTESRLGERPTIVVQYGVSEGEKPATSWPYELYRLPTLDAAARAAERLQSDPSWACCDLTANALIDTSKLTRVASGNATLANSGGIYGEVSYLRLPIQPDEGWYVVVLLKERAPAQAILQVTDLAAFVQTTDTRTVAWLSDLRTQAPVPGATVAISGGATLGTTDARGVLLVPTPTSLITYASEADYWVSPTPHVLAVRAPDGRGLLAAIGMERGWGYPPQQQSSSSARTAEAQWWHMLSTDRGKYRSDDVIHAWGVVRARSDLGVPGSVEVRLGAAGGGDAPAVAAVPVSPTSRGVFSADLPVEGLPLGEYELSLYVGGQRVQYQWIEVTQIRKPAYRIDLTTDQRVYVTGDTIPIKGDVSFYDGSRTPGISIRTGYDESPTATSTTDADGRFTASLPAQMGSWQPYEGWNWIFVTSAPATPEEGTIGGERDLVVFPSRVWLAGDASLAGSRLSIRGTLTKLDAAKVERQLANGGWELDPAGAVIAGQAVGVRVIHVIPVRKQIGTAYDFIDKVTRPVYEYSTREEVILTRTATTNADGRISLGVNVPASGHEYRVELTARDSRHRLVRLSLSAWQRQTEVQPWSYPYLVARPGCMQPTITTALGDTATVVAHEGNGATGRDGQYLFMIGERGLTDAVWQTSATLRRTLGASDLPGFEVRAVRLTPTGYQVLNAARVRVDPASKSIGVTLTPDRTRYRPGERVTIAVRTVGPDGRPIAADVIVRAVDEKLFTIGAALDVNVAEALLQAQPSGFLQSFASHQLPYVVSEGCGGGGGGGARDDFRDSATFQRIQTGSDGRGSLSFVVPDDLTSWHVTASAVSSDLDSGSNSLLVPVGLPFFAEAVLAPEYLGGERPVLVVRAYGDSLHAGDPVNFTVRSPDLGLQPVSVTGRAFVPQSISLPVLEPGRHEITIEASAGAGGMSDSLTRTVVVVQSRLGRLEQRLTPLMGTLQPAGGDGLTAFVVSDRGRGSLVPILTALAGETGARVDRAAAASIARQILIDEFDVAPADLPPDTFDIARYQRSGVGLLPYASPDVYLTAMFAIAAPESLMSSIAADWLRSQLDESGAGKASELRAAALAGLAGLGRDVSDELAAMDTANLSIRGRLWLGLGLLAAGDEAAARALERGLLSSYGEQLGQWVRLNTGLTNEATLEASALMLALAGGLGDDVAAGLQAYVASQPSTEHVFPMEMLAYVKGALDRLPRAEGRFAWSVGGVRHEVTLGPGGAFSLTLTAAQRATFSLERLAGDLLVSSTWTGPTDTQGLPRRDGLTVTRTVRPATDAPRDHLVHVTLTVTFGPGIPAGNYEVTDLTPSGLAPLVATGAWPDDNGGDQPPVPNALAPYAVEGQRVGWVVSPSTSQGSTVVLAYDARVVSPGTYVWEPAVVQSTDAAVIGAHTEAAPFTIQ